jgi:hypothetical protein
MSVNERRATPVITYPYCVESFGHLLCGDISDRKRRLRRLGVQLEPRTSKGSGTWMFVVTTKLTVFNCPKVKWQFSLRTADCDRNAVLALGGANLWRQYSRMSMQWGSSAPSFAISLWFNLRNLTLVWRILVHVKVSGSVTVGEGMVGLCNSFVLEIMGVDCNDDLRNTWMWTPNKIQPESAEFPRETPGWQLLLLIDCWVSSLWDVTSCNLKLLQSFLPVSLDKHTPGCKVHHLLTALEFH